MARFWRRALEGLLSIDHRAGDGTKSVPAGTLLEAISLTCNHCKRVVYMRPERTRERGHCYKCDRFVCDECYLTHKLTGECLDFERYADMVLECALKGRTPPPFA